jgi:hypothetical protein
MTTEKDCGEERPERARTSDGRSKSTRLSWHDFVDTQERLQLFVLDYITAHRLKGSAGNAALTRTLPER